MKRAVAIALAAVLAGCTGAADVPSASEPTVSAPAATRAVEPEAGDCWSTGRQNISAVLGRPGYLQHEDCGSPHQFKTVLVGQLAADLAGAADPPGIAALHDAYAACDAAARDHLGSPWQDRRLHLFVQAPTPDDWRAGGRWFRCDLGRLKFVGPELYSWLSSQSAEPPEGLALRCGQEFSTMVPTLSASPRLCTEPHTIEFAGSVAATAEAFPATEAAADREFLSRCEARVRTFTGMSRGALERIGAGAWYTLTSGADEWRAGSRSARCFVRTAEPVSRSLRAAA